MRLQKYISRSGHCSRRHAEKLIAGGKVKVNGVVADVLGTKVDPEKDVVVAEGKRLSLETRAVYIALNKPPGYVASCDHPGKRTVMELVDIDERIYPVGRLDEDSRGLLLLTNDGNLHLRLTHPSFDHEKEYVVEVADPIPPGVLNSFRKGVELGGVTTRSARVKSISRTRFIIVLKEGRNRQIRRMVRKAGTRVVSLERVRVANIRLKGLAPGQWRHLAESERRRLMEMAVK